MYRALSLRGPISQAVRALRAMASASTRPLILAPRTDPVKVAKLRADDNNNAIRRRPEA
jgi:hypothetical protein